MIENERNNFPYSGLAAYIEQIAGNALDADATRIEFEIERPNKFDASLVCKDNGKGMPSEKSFEEYHKLGSYSKTKEKGKTIGFAGIGSIILIDRLFKIQTETKSETFEGASEWLLQDHKEDTEWKEIMCNRRVPFKTGTYVKADLKYDEEKAELTDEFIIKTIRYHYGAVLEKFYDKEGLTIEFFVSGKKIEPKTYNITEEFEQTYSRTFVIKGNDCSASFLRADEPIPEDERGIWIVVNKKTIFREDGRFGQFTKKDEYILGRIIADHLISDITTNKSDINRRGSKWKELRKKSAVIYGKFLKRTGANAEEEVVTTREKEIGTNVITKFNQLMNSSEFSDMARLIRQGGVSVVGSVVVGGGGPVPGNPISTTGKTIVPAGGHSVIPAFEDTGSKTRLTPDSKGKSHGTVRRGKIKGVQVTIDYDVVPDLPQESWYDETQRHVTINCATSSYKYLPSKKTKEYHLWRCVLSAIIDKFKIEKDKKLIMFQRVFGALTRV